MDYKITADSVLRRYQVLKDSRAQWDTLWQELADYIIPRKNKITEKAATGQKQTTKLMDSTAEDANNRLGATMHGTLTSAVIQWFSLNMRLEELNKDGETREWLEEVAKRMYKQIQQSNFNAEMQELYLDLGAFGTACIFIDTKEPTAFESFGGFLFQTFPIGSYVIAENKNSVVDTVIYEFEISVEALVDKFGRNSVSSESQKMYDDHKLDDKVRVVHAVYPRVGASESTDATTPARKLPFASCFVEADRRKKLHEGGFIEFPFAVPRWAKASGETYGRSPGMTALPDIRTLNRAVELRLKAWAKAVDPPLLVRDRGVIGKVRMTPASINSVRNMDNIKEMITQARFDVANFSEEQLRGAIKRIFFADQLEFPPMAEQGTPISATEANIRFQLMQRILGPTLGRHQSEGLAPIINRVFRIMLRADLFPEIPQAVLDAHDENRAQIDVEYEGPLARAQRGADLESIDAAVQEIMVLSEKDPTVIDVLNSDEIARGIAERRGVPSTMIRSPEEVAEIRAKRAKEIEKQQEMEQQAQMAKAAGQAAPAMREMREMQGPPAMEEGEGVEEEEMLPAEAFE